MHPFKQYVESKKVSVNLKKKKRPKENKWSKDKQTANGQESRDEGDEQGRAVGGLDMQGVSFTTSSLGLCVSHLTLIPSQPGGERALPERNSM